MRRGYFKDLPSVSRIVAVFFGLVLSLACTDGRHPDHVVLISIDGFRPEFYQDASWPAPMIQQMAQEGVQVNAVRGVFPSVTYPSHTTMITGAVPRRHGIYYNTPFEPEGQTGRWYWHASAIRVPTLWDAVRKAGLKSASISWPASVGGPIDWNIPEFWSLEPEGSAMDAIRSVTRPPELFAEVIREATGPFTDADFEDRLLRDDRIGVAAAYLLEQHRPSLLTVHLIAVDYFQHQSGRDAPMVRRAITTADQAVRTIVAAAERSGIQSRTAFIVTGDHGFVDRDKLVAPNVWLVEAGMMEARRDRGDWRAAFHRTGGSVFLHLRHPEDREAVAQVRALLARLPSETQRLFRVIERDELDRVGADPAVPLALSAVPGTSFSASFRPPAVREAEGGNHGHFPDLPQVHTGFIGWGMGFRSGAVLSSMGIEDMAPLIAELLGIPFEAPDGVSPRSLLAVQD